MPLLSVEDLRVHFHTDEGVLPAVDGVSFTVDAGEVVGLVGESGCGKSVLSMSLLRLVPSPPGRIVGGRVLFEGRDLVTLPEPALRDVRGHHVAMVFQEPMTSLNPVLTVGDQVAEAVMRHQHKDEDEARAVAIEMLRATGIPSPEARVDEYPHQLSGGMRQRVMIAMALSCRPKLLVADEPTTALDVTIQAQILDLLRQLRERHGMAILLVTHDLGVVAETCDRVVVMYAGRVVETARAADLFARPTHPYTAGLLASLPGRAAPGARLPTIPGNVPSPLDFPSGCRFRTRCAVATTACETSPPAVDVGPGHTAWCHHPRGA